MIEFKCYWCYQIKIKEDKTIFKKENNITYIYDENNCVEGDLFNCCLDCYTDKNLDELEFNCLSCDKLFHRELDSFRDCDCGFYCLSCYEENGIDCNDCYNCYECDEYKNQYNSNWCNGCSVSYCKECKNVYSCNGFTCSWVNCNECSIKCVGCNKYYCRNCNCEDCYYVQCCETIKNEDFIVECDNCNFDNCDTCIFDCNFCNMSFCIECMKNKNSCLNCFKKPKGNKIYQNTDKLKCRNCPICLDKFKYKEEIIKTNCNHLFHYMCIKKWKSCNCPICRTKHFLD